MIRKREEDQADKWLREHDPYYTLNNPHKMRNEKYPYYTPDQEVKVKRMEIPISCILDSSGDPIEIDTLELFNMD